MTQSDKLYRFYSRSQHVLNISVQGRRIRVKFSTPYNGLARYSTRDGSVASQIRKSLPFRNGMIKEDETIVDETKQEVIPIQTQIKPENTTKKDGEIPLWMRRGVKVNSESKVTSSANRQTGAASKSAASASKSEAITKPKNDAESKPVPVTKQVIKPTSDAATTKLESVEESDTSAKKEVNTTTETTEPGAIPDATDKSEKDADGKAVQGQMFGIKLEDVETYMEAKEYVRDVLGADVTRKEEVKEYCTVNNIVFPKFSFD